MKFDMNAAWRDATGMIAANRELLLIVAGIFFFLPGVAFGFVSGGIQAAALANPQNPEQAMLEAYSQWWWLIVLMGIMSMLGSLALLALLRDPDRPTVARAIAAAIKGLPSAFGTYIILFIAIGVPLSILMEAAGGDPVADTLVKAAALAVLLFAFVRFALASPVIALEKVYNPFKILARSWRLTAGNGLRLFAFYALLAIAYLVCAIVLGMVISLLTLIAGPSMALAINAVVAGLLGAMASVVIVAVLAAIHQQVTPRRSVQQNGLAE